MKSSKSKTTFMLSMTQRLELEATVWSMLSRVPKLKKFRIIRELSMHDLEVATDCQLIMLGIELRGILVTYSKGDSNE